MLYLREKSKVTLRRQSELETKLSRIKQLYYSISVLYFIPYFVSCFSLSKPYELNIDLMKVGYSIKPINSIKQFNLPYPAVRARNW